MKQLLIILLFLSMSYSQCDANGDGELNVVDIVVEVNCILENCWDDQPSCVDIDGNVYETVQIGEQLWMAENLMVTNYRNGDPITHIINNGDWGSYDVGQYGVYNNDLVNEDIYGNLYNWYAVDDVRGICPEGFHVPSDDEFKELEMYLGMNESEVNGFGWRGTNEGSKLAGNAALWNDGNLENNSEFGTSGFNALPAGVRSYYNGSFYSMGVSCAFWLSTESDSSYGSSHAWHRELVYGNLGVWRSSTLKPYGYSVRCIAD